MKSFKQYLLKNGLSKKLYYIPLKKWGLIRNPYFYELNYIVTYKRGGKVSYIIRLATENDCNKLSRLKQQI